MECMGFEPIRPELLKPSNGCLLFDNNHPAQVLLLATRTPFGGDDGIRTRTTVSNSTLE